jgi:integrase
MSVAGRKSTDFPVAGRGRDRTGFLYRGARRVPALRFAPFSPAGFDRMVERAGSEAKLGFKAHPHMLRHACGYALANKGHDTRALQAYLGYSLRRIRVRARSVRPRSAPSSVLQLGH